MRNYEPLVSIIIPVYNGANYMREAIESAIGQTYRNIEVIVVNDGSTDNGETELIAKTYGEKIIYFLKPNGGCASALNCGISLMKGEWFSWLSHDDLYYPDKIKNSINFVVENCLQDGNNMIYCNSDLIDENGKTIFHPVSFKSGCFNQAQLFRGLFFNFSINGCALLIHKNTIQKVGSFDENLKYSPDFDYWLRVAMNGFGMVSFDERLCSNRVHAKQVSVLAKERMRPDIAMQLIKINNMLINPDQENKDMLKLTWIYAYSRGFFKEADILFKSLEKQNIDLIKLKKDGNQYRIKFKIEFVLKRLYRLIFKKGMD